MHLGRALSAATFMAALSRWLRCCSPGISRIGNELFRVRLSWHGDTRGRERSGQHSGETESHLRELDVVVSGGNPGRRCRHVSGVAEVARRCAKTELLPGSLPSVPKHA